MRPRPQLVSQDFSPGTDLLPHEDAKSRQDTGLGNSYIMRPVHPSAARDEQSGGSSFLKLQKKISTGDDSAQHTLQNLTAEHALVTRFSHQRQNAEDPNNTAPQSTNSYGIQAGNTRYGARTTIKEIYKKDQQIRKSAKAPILEDNVITEHASTHQRHKTLVPSIFQDVGSLK